MCEHMHIGIILHIYLGVSSVNRPMASLRSVGFLDRWLMAPYDFSVAQRLLPALLKSPRTQVHESIVSSLMRGGWELSTDPDAPHVMPLKLLSLCVVHLTAR